MTGTPLSPKRRQRSADAFLVRSLTGAFSGDSGHETDRLQCAPHHI
jgi:hypothetical protein